MDRSKKLKNLEGKKKVGRGPELFRVFSKPSDRKKNGGREKEKKKEQMGQGTTQESFKKGEAKGARPAPRRTGGERALTAVSRGR